MTTAVEPTAPDPAPDFDRRPGKVERAYRRGAQHALGYAIATAAKSPDLGTALRRLALAQDAARDLASRPESIRSLVRELEQRVRAGGEASGV